MCASGPVLGGCGVHGLYAPGRSGNIVGNFEPGLERESSRAGEPEGCNRIQNTILRAVIIEELNFLNWDFFFPGFPEKHAGIIIEGGADLPFPPRFLKTG